MGRSTLVKQIPFLITVETSANRQSPIANRRQYPCSTCVKNNLNLKTKEKLLQMSMKDLREIVSELQLGVRSRKKADIVQVLVTHASNCSNRISQQEHEET